MIKADKNSKMKFLHINRLKEFHQKARIKRMYSLFCKIINHLKKHNHPQMPFSEFSLFIIDQGQFRLQNNFIFYLIPVVVKRIHQLIFLFRLLLQCLRQIQLQKNLLIEILKLLIYKRSILLIQIRKIELLIIKMNQMNKILSFNLIKETKYRIYSSE
ncbi:unnamed protein product [Paramecium pentaurelia]|uniref:Uncharacterized protein n=1 Tax=Paramecium pentaurelia TaxID=43138 RepID=A0A8S1X3X3_9CILI|nr:unnamed protein product [Paramecium pentaurelia]